MVTTFNISKEVYFNSISAGFSSKVAILNAVKNDYNRMDVCVNGKSIKDYHIFLEYIQQNYPDYLEKILLLTNQNAHFYYYNKIFNILSKKDFHIVSCESDKEDVKYLKTEFNLNSIIKQAILYNKYSVITVDEEGDKCHRTMLVTTVIDLVILDPILIKIQYLD